MTASANADLVRSIYAGWERGDYSSTERAHPEIEFVFPDGPSPGTWAGVAGMAEVWREWLSAWISETPGPTIEQAAEVAALLADLPAQPTALQEIERSNWG